ncbi:cytochrome P450 7A1-like [Dreissena polymorpha]|uniref:cytochrome P450 7A1-like n=1 Tax=Dreissena polymorpha TaxID=45954 RepID=UPI0022641890|nr:cytochrome P450 7A1-like [Dreissena polymorpha]
MAAVTLYLAVAVVTLLVMYIKYFGRKKKEGEPPIVPGHFLFGNGMAFSQNAVEFIHKSTARFGKVFTIRLLNQHVTIINDPHSYEQVCKERNFDFDAIQKQVNNNVFSLKLHDSKKMIKEASKKVKGQYLYATMQLFAHHLQEAFDASTESTPVENGWCKGRLRAMSSKTMFKAIFRTIFGKEKPDDVFEPMTVYKNFDLFHKYFNFLWLGLPIKLFPKACRALEMLVQMPTSNDIINRDDVSDYIRYSTQFMKANGQTEADIIGHNLVFLHVNYNTFRVSYWLIYYLTKHPEAIGALVAEIDDTVRVKSETCDDDCDIELSIQDLDRLPVLNSFLNETIRYTSGVLMVRAITEDTAFTMEDGSVHNLRAGDRVAMYPPAIHNDPEVFKNPEEFKYDRFIDAKFYKEGKEIRNPLLAFGSLCPGKRLAMTQAKWFIFNFAHQFDFQTEEGQACCPDVKYYGNEILPPTNDVDFLYRRIENRRRIEFVHDRL